MRKNSFYICAWAVFIVGIVISLVTGKYPLSMTNILSGDTLELGIFLNLRLSRTVMTVLAGFGLSVAGYVYQTIFKNPIASPDIIGVSSGACAGAGTAIIFLGGGTVIVAIGAFFGGLIAVFIAILLAGAANTHGGGQRLSSFVLSGIAVNALAQAILMLLKRTADPFSELASLEFWTMGSLSDVTSKKVIAVSPIIILSLIFIFYAYRQITMLSLNSDEAKMLGVSVNKIRSLILIATTFVVGAIVSVTGLITFVGLLGPHITRLLTKIHSKKTMFFSGILGASIMLYSDSLARSIASTEIPISILTSLLGAPLLIYLVLKGGRVE